MADDKIQFHYLKSNLFREVFATGAHGGLSPDGYVHFSLYNQRRPVPLQTVHSLSGNEVGAELRDERISKEGVIRSVEVGIYMDIDAAESLGKWLLERVNEGRKLGVPSQNESMKKASK